MLYLIPTKRGIGVEMWGTYEDLYTLYDATGKFWRLEDYKGIDGFKNRDALISGFSYELRKGFQGTRLKQQHSHFTTEEATYYGCQFSWPHILFAINALRYNMRFVSANKLDLAIFLQVEYWMQRCMEEFDPVVAKDLIPFIEGSIHSASPVLYQLMRRINLEYFQMGGGKEAFARLPELLSRTIQGSWEYEFYLQELEQQAAQIGCKVWELEWEEDETVYDIEW